MASLAKISRPVARLIGRQAAVQAICPLPVPLTWVVAPAGSGKTSFGLEFCQACTGPTAWLRLDEADADPASFLMYFQQAIVTGSVAPGWQPPALLREHLPALQGYLRLFIRSLAGAIAPEACIVMDDAHRCQQAPFFKQFLEILIEELPPGVRLLVLSRAPAPANCARLLAHGMMQEVPVSALAFSPEETEVLLHVLRVERATELRDAVFRITRGWPAGIALIAAWLKRRPQDALKTEDIMSEAVAGYLAEEMFSALSDAERETLLAICWLPYFNGAWAVSLSGMPGAADVAARLAAHGALIYEYPGRQYMLHPLFRRFLRNWAEAHHDAAQRLQRVERSVALLEAAGNLDAAIKLALEHGLPQCAAPLIELRAEELFATARHQTLTRWIDALPAQHCGPWHYYWLGLAVFMTDTARAREALLKAHEAFAAQSNHKYRFLALSAIISSYFFNGAAREPLRDFLNRHVDPHRDYELVPDPTLKAHLTHSVWSGLFIVEPGHADMPLWEQRAFDALRQPADATLKVRLSTMLTQHYFLSGRYHQIRSVHALIGALPESASWSSYARYLAYLIRLYDALVSLDHARLIDSYAGSCRSSEESGIRIMDSHYALIHATGLLFRGEHVKVRAILDKVVASTPPGHHNLAGHVHLTWSWASSWMGDARAALEHARLAREAGRRFGCVPYELCSSVAECVAHAVLDREACRAQLVALRRLGEQTNYPVAAIHADLLDAWLLLSDGASCDDVSDASRFVQRAFGQLKGQGGGYLSFAIPRILQPLCVHALRHDIETDTACTLIRAFRLTPPEDAPQSWPWPVRIHCFGGFRLELDGEPIRSQGKSKHRQLDVVRMLAAHAPAPLPFDRAAEALWPDSDGDSARHALETTLSRLRGTLGADTIRLEQGMLSFNRDICWTDTSALEHQLSLLERTIERADPTTGDVADAANRLLDLYRGEMLAGESATWMLAQRELWRSRIARVLGAAGRLLANNDDMNAATTLLEHAIEADPYCKSLTETLMRINLDMGRYAEGLAVYRRYRRIALSVLGTPVSSEIEALAQQLQAAGS
ncbi:BTAD domain-containing putative transcriptional regulator [Noviherbaspirillum sp.]|jgi:DNA-binding SARP family transcriptional activator|uniref:BTAD domain-containing putative transcriptional regulator n=1 Tax=Noviherbaspirillum sp. TaxID=1926288 RepID=UPI0025F4BF46|nr:BTAD domain-containing putative transcriptional regulator [Noviherbaspirillum sp.]